MRAKGRFALPTDAWIGLGLLLVTLSVFARALGDGYVNFDDPTYVTANRMVQGGLNPAGIRWALGAIVSGHWHPLTLISHELDWTLFGAGSAGPHGVSVLWHAANVVLVYLFFLRLGANRGGAVAAALLFGLHPLRVESVAWISERKDVLSGFFGLLTLLCYLAAQREHRVSKRWGWLTASLFAFAVGLMAKSMLVTLPAVLLLLDYWPLRRPLRIPAVWLEKAPFAALAGASSAAAYFAQRSSGGVAIHGDALNRGANALVALPRYLLKTFWPVHLAPHYPLPDHWRWEAVATSAATLLAISGLAVVLRNSRPWLLVGWAWFVGMLIPVSGIVQVGRQALADRYTYLPGLGLLIVAVFAAQEWRGGSARRSVILGGVASLVCLACALLTWQQVGYWHDSESLWRHTLSVTGPSSVANNNLGTALQEKGDLPGALENFRAAIRQDPDFTDALSNLGGALTAAGEPAGAIPPLRRALELNPMLAAARVNMGEALVDSGDIAAGIAEYVRVLDQDPAAEPALRGYGMALAMQGRFADALERLNAARKLSPNDAVVRGDLGMVFAQMGRWTQAVEEDRAAVSLRTNEEAGRYNLGSALAQLGRMEEAADEFRRAVQLAPADRDAHASLGFSLMRLGHRLEAASEFQKALGENPNMPVVRQWLRTLDQTPRN